VAHDLKNPICSTLNSTEVLRDFYCSKALDAQGMEFVEASIRSLRRMANLIDRLLEYSQVGRCGRALQELDLADAVRAARANLEAAIDLGTACLEVGKLPRVSGDESALTQLFQNLIANAVKFCNGRPAIVGIRCHGIEDGWQVSVSDNGIGIDPKFHRSIFEPFTRLNTRPTYEGSGIGLATCKRIVEQHGGRIWVESEPGQGATFHFTLPQAPADV
jgi:signal transduction histidine kinase